MKQRSKVLPPRSQLSAPVSDLLTRYGCGPIRFSGHDDALYERHLLFDDVVDLGAAGARQRFEAAAHSVRDVLSQRWILTENTYAGKDPETDLLSVDGISDRAIAVQQYFEPFSRTICKTIDRSEAAGCARRA